MSKDWTQQKAIEAMEEEITTLRAENERLRMVIERVFVYQSSAQKHIIELTRAALEGK